MRASAWRALTLTPALATVTARAAAFTVAALLTVASADAAVRAAAAGAQADEPLYRCTDERRVEAEPVGLTLCDAAPTAALADRAASDNLQVRAGALVVAVAPDGSAGRERMRPRDLIYRVAGVDVAGGGEAAAQLAGIVADSDTGVNFLRGGRPYRVKLRR